jgi:hypothetical protein
LLGLVEVVKSDHDYRVYYPPHDSKNRHRHR